MRLLAYAEPRPGPVLLLVPAPIKRHYIWDLMPGRSVVRSALAAGFNTHLLAWADPDDAASAACGLETYADRLIGAAVDLLGRRHGTEAVLLAGHSLGGTLAALFASLHPERVRGLALIEAPLRFGPDAGVLPALVRSAPAMPERFRDRLATVPGSLLTDAAVIADPIEHVAARWLDALASGRDAEALAAHLRVLRWAYDELAMPAPLFADIVDRLYREDALDRGALVLGGRRAAPENLAMRLLAVVDPRSRLIPPAAALPTVQRRRDTWSVHERGRERGVALQHVGSLIGRDSQARLWPLILGALEAVWARAS
jgi:polyhydroxyalkanoate synthase